METLIEMEESLGKVVKEKDLIVDQLQTDLQVLQNKNRILEGRLISMEKLVGV